MVRSEMEYIDQEIKRRWRIFCDQLWEQMERCGTGDTPAEILDRVRNATYDVQSDPPGEAP